MKKIIALLLAILMTFALFACGDDFGSPAGSANGEGRNGQHEHPTGETTKDMENTVANSQYSPGMGAGGAAPSQTQSTAPKPTETQSTAPKPTETQSTAPKPTETQLPETTTVYEVTIWVPETIRDLTKLQIEAFNASNELDVYIRANIESVYEYDAGAFKETDPTGGADLFIFTQDKLESLVKKGALTPQDEETRAWLLENFDSFSLQNITTGADCYAYPLGDYNSFFVYYDKSVISEADIGSLEAMIAACEASGRKFSFELLNGWYSSSFFFGAGCTSVWTQDEEGRFVCVKDDFNSEQGIKAATAMQSLLNSSCFKNSNSITDFAASVPSAVVISGAWDYEAGIALLGDDLGVARLPAYTVDGETYQLSAFSGMKMLGIKPQTDPERAAVLAALAKYLADAQCQLERLEQENWTPSHVGTKNSDVAQSKPYVQVLLAQNENSHIMGTIHGSWWDMASALASNLKSGAPVKEAVEIYAELLQSLFATYEWSVVGDFAESGWMTDVDMVIQSEGNYRTEYAVTLTGYNEYLVRYNHSWDIAYGGSGLWDGEYSDNIVTTEEGSYYIWFDATTGRSWLEPA